MNALKDRKFSRRAALAGGAVLLAGAGAGGLAWWRAQRAAYDRAAGIPASVPQITSTTGAMPYRAFGKTGLAVSEVGFGSWATGGKAYGAVDRQESLRALARAEELGCNFVDTAMVYGDSELLLGEFLRGRRNRWIIATKYSAQPAGMRATLEQQLQRLEADAIDFYQLHWGSNDKKLYEDLYALKRAGKVRFVGVSLNTAADIDHVIDHSMIDGVQLPFSLLDPDPFLARVDRLRRSRLAVIVRSCLKEGFLTGKFTRDASFPDPNDQRHDWSRARIENTVDEVERLRFLEADAGTLLRAAVAYPLSFPEVSTVLLGTKSVSQADSNFGQAPGARLSTASLARVRALQEELDVTGIRTFAGFVRHLRGRS